MEWNDIKTDQSATTPQRFALHKLLTSEFVREAVIVQISKADASVLIDLLTKYGITEENE